MDRREGLLVQAARRRVQRQGRANVVVDSTRRGGVLPFQVAVIQRQNLVARGLGDEQLLELSELFGVSAREVLGL